MKIIKILKIKPFTHLENDTRIKGWEVVYKLKGNKHHMMNVFGKDEIEAYQRAVEVIKNLKKET
jgi:hypothetical protein